LALALLVSLWLSALCLVQAFSSPGVVQDDARQHVFWAYRYLDPGLFPGDLIADYFQAVAPFGYRLLYRAAAWVGLDPFVFNQLLPPVLGAVTTLFVFHLARALTPAPLTAFLATVLLNLMLWGVDDIPSGTPRAFGYPLLAASLYFLSRHTLWSYLATVVLLAAFYPSALLVSLATLALTLVRREGWRLHIRRDRRDYLRVGAALALAALALLPFFGATDAFRPVTHAEEAREALEFLPGGRTSFYTDDPWEFWVTGVRSGVLPWEGTLHGAILVLALLWPLLAWARGHGQPSTPGRQGTGLLLRVVVGSLVLFLLAHAVVFELYEPNTYTQYSLRIVVAIAAALSLTWLWKAVHAALLAGVTPPPRLVWTASVATLLASLAVPGARQWLSDELVWGNYRRGRHPELYAYLQSRPMDSQIASLATEADFLPSLARRSVLVSREYAITYHQGYYRRIRQRIEDLIAAELTPDAELLKAYLADSGADFLLVDREADLLGHPGWLRQYPEALASAHQRLSGGRSPALSRFLHPCAVWGDRNLVLLESTCILAPGPGDPVHPPQPGGLSRP
jgi:hypothetical protein